MKIIAKLGLSIKELIERNQFILYLLVFLVTFLVYLLIQSVPSFLDPDSFYHLKMAKLIAERGPILNFPWLQFTVLKDYYVDHHFLYHVLAIPFIKILGDFIGFKFYTVILATLFIILAYYFFKKEGLRYPEIFAMILLFSPAFMFRISLAKATAFSLILLFLGIYFIFKQRPWLLAMISFIYVWSYGGFLLVLVMSILFCLAFALHTTLINQPLWLKLKKFSWLKPISYGQVFFKSFFEWTWFKFVIFSLGGIIAGLLVNPYFPKNIKFYWQQLIQIGLINYRGLVNVGGEWYPYEFLRLISDSGVAIIVGIIIFFLFFIFYKKQTKQSVFFFLAAILFFALTLKSKRYVEYFIPFLVFFSAFSLHNILGEIKIKNFLQKLKIENYILGRLTKTIIIYIAIIFPLIMVKDAWLTWQSYRGGIEFTRYQGLTNYLLQNSAPGDIIMQTDWDDFPMLFYQDDKNYYIVGLDPTFMYNYNPALYNLFADITMAKKSENLYALVKDNFKAKYFVVDKVRPQLITNLQNDGNFFLVYKDKDGSIFKLR